MDKEPIEPKFDLEERTFKFAQRVRAWIRKLPRTLTNREDAKQLTRSSGSVGANYIEANEGLGPKDFRMHLKICRKEAKESKFFIGLIDCGENKVLKQEQENLRLEADQLTRILGAIIRKKA